MFPGLLMVENSHNFVWIQTSTKYNARGKILVLMIDVLYGTGNWSLAFSVPLTDV